MAQLRLIRQDQAGNAHIDGSCSSCSSGPFCCSCELTEKLLLREAFTQKSFYTQQAFTVHREAFAHSRLSHTASICPVLIIKPLPDLRCLQYARPHHGSSAYSWGLALANTIRNRFFLLLIKPLPDLHHLCGHCQPDFGEWAVVAPSMWAFPAWFWRMSASCAIYVPERELDVDTKLWGQASSEDCKKQVTFRDMDGSTYPFEVELSHLSPAFCLWHRWRNSRIWAIYSQPRVYMCVTSIYIYIYIHDII